ncbi:AMP-binding protein, partial [Streptomyces sp. DT24]|uniref:AMP-binding protein n=1 Tax=Streptomyces sp. DT24 TaxID=3416520 RepID=UPI003CF86FBB
NLADLVAAGAAHAQGPALVYEDDELSRDTFDDHVNRLTRLLITRGIGPESIVAVALPRSHNLLIAIHAVIRAGAAYLPLDLTLPHDRLTYMTDTAQPVCVLTDLESLNALPDDLNGADPVVLDSPDTQAELAGLPGNTVTDDERTTPLHPHHPAYLIFTSGSTGRPKGVLTEHHAIVNRIQWMQHTYTLHPHERLLHKTPTTFDVSVWELFWPLTQGATLIIAKPDGHKDPHYLTHLIRHQHINITHFVPSMLAAFLNETHLHTLPT